MCGGSTKERETGTQVLLSPSPHESYNVTTSHQDHCNTGHNDHKEHFPLLLVTTKTSVADITPHFILRP